MTPLEAVEAVIFSGRPFTYFHLSLVNVDAGGKEAKDRLADRTIQKYRRKGMITFIREDGKVEWSLTAAGEAERTRRGAGL